MNDHILEGTDERRRRQRRLAIALTLGIIMSSPALALDVNQTPWLAAAQSAGLDDPLILRAIALAESGRVNDQGFIEPWPWAPGLYVRTFTPPKVGMIAAFRVPEAAKRYKARCARRLPLHEADRCWARGPNLQ